MEKRQEGIDRVKSSTKKKWKGRRRRMLTKKIGVEEGLIVSSFMENTTRRKVFGFDQLMESKFCLGRKGLQLHSNTDK